MDSIKSIKKEIDKRFAKINDDNIKELREIINASKKEIIDVLRSTSLMLRESTENIKNPKLKAYFDSLRKKTEATTQFMFFLIYIVLRQTFYVEKK